MIAIDSSSFIGFFEGASGEDVEAVDLALEHSNGVLPPVVLTELLSDSAVDSSVVKLLLALPLIEISVGYWERAGALRALILSNGHRARLADTLIAQSCIDHGISLITRDADFRHFARWGRLRLA